MKIKSGNLAWDVVGFPVIGRQDNYNFCDGRNAPLEKAGLIGADLMPLPVIKWQESGSTSNYADTTIKVPYNTLLFHQCDPFGDVFVQRLYVGRKITNNAGGITIMRSESNNGGEIVTLSSDSSAVPTAPIINR